MAIQLKQVEPLLIWIDFLIKTDHFIAVEQIVVVAELGFSIEVFL